MNDNINKDTILNKMNEDLNLKPKNNALDETFNNLAGSFVDILNEAVAKEKAKTEY
jgi:hypothetical protein